MAPDGGWPDNSIRMRGMPSRRAFSALGALFGVVLGAMCPGVTVASVTVATDRVAPERSCPAESRPSCCPERGTPASPSPCGGGGPCRLVVNPGTEALKSLKVTRGKTPETRTVRTIEPDRLETGARCPRPALEASPPVFLLVRVFRN